MAAIMNHKLAEFAAGVVKSELFDVFVDAKNTQLGQIMLKIKPGDTAALEKLQREVILLNEYLQFIHDITNESALAEHFANEDAQDAMQGLQLN